MLISDTPQDFQLFHLSVLPATNPVLNAAFSSISVRSWNYDKQGTYVVKLTLRRFICSPLWLEYYQNLWSLQLKLLLVFFSRKKKKKAKETFHAALWKHSCRFLVSCTAHVVLWNFDLPLIVADKVIIFSLTWQAGNRKPLEKWEGLKFVETPGSSALNHQVSRAQRHSIEMSHRTSGILIRK